MIRTGLAWSAFLLAAMLAASGYGYLALPADASVPIQWGLDGEVNRRAGKLAALAFAPVLAAAVSAIAAIAAALDPRRENIASSADFYLVAWLGSLALLAIGHVAVVLAAVSGWTPSPDILLAGSALVAMATGNLMARSKSNFFAGLRTPWTLSSDHAWSVGNRLAGWGFVLGGLACIAAILAGQAEAGLVAMLGAMVAGLVVGTVASYFAWRADPEKR